MLMEAISEDICWWRIKKTLNLRIRSYLRSFHSVGGRTCGNIVLCRAYLWKYYTGVRRIMWTVEIKYWCKAQLWKCYSSVGHTCGSMILV
jgi:hypothetical protein